MPERNILDELMKLLHEPGPINWSLAEQMAGHIAGTPEPIDPWLAEEYLDLTRLAQMRVSEAAGLPVDPLAEVLLVDRAGWAEHHLRSFRYTAEPLTEMFAAAPDSGPLSAMLKPLGPALLGMQMGGVVGMMSGDALGLFDAGLPAAAPAGLTFQVPNLEAFAAEHSLDPRSVRLWAALHEVIHEGLCARPWVRPHLFGLFENLAGAMEIDPEAVKGWQENLTDSDPLEAMLARSGADGLFAGPVQEEPTEEIRSFVEMVEGYGAYLVEQAAAGLLPDLDSIRAAMASRQMERTGSPGLIGSLETGSSAGLYGRGAAFCTEVASRWGVEALPRIWENADNLPAAQELNDATGWAARVLLEDPFPG